MRIGQFAIYAGTNASTVRYYEQIGLLLRRSVSGAIGEALERRMWRGLSSSGVAVR